MNVTIRPNAESAYQYVAQYCAEALKKGGEHPILVAAGGTTFIPVYRLLAGLYADSLDWNAVTVLLGDERSVKEGDAHSNAATIRRELIEALPADNRPRFLPMLNATDPESAAAAYDLILPQEITVSLLGLGSDGHTASLFAGSRDQWSAEGVLVTQGELPPMIKRITLSPKQFSRSDYVVVLALGEAKAKAVKETLRDEMKQYPLTWITPQKGEIQLVVDPAAAGSR